MRDFIKENKINPVDYEVIKLWRPDNEKVCKFQPSKEMIRPGQYPFRNIDENSEIFCLFSGMSGNN
jgi:hypothetical protein